MNGRKRLGIMLSEVVFPNFPVMLRQSGYDFWIIDCEHGPFSVREAAEMTAVARGCGVETIVRVPGTGREWITKALDFGADGLLVPMVRDAADARQAVAYAKYAPLGRRGVSISRAHSGYAPGDMTAYMEAANRRTKVYIQIELASALSDAAAIAAVPGVYALMIGPSDLAADLGVFPSQDDPALLDAVTHAARAAADAGIASGVITSHAPLLAAARAAGMTEFCCGSELRLLTRGLRENRRTVFPEEEK